MDLSSLIVAIAVAVVYGVILYKVSQHTKKIGSDDDSKIMQTEVSGVFAMMKEQKQKEGMAFPYEPMEDRRAKIKKVALTPDGRYALVLDRDRVLSVWDFNKTRLIKKLGSHCLRVKAIAISPDGKRAVSSTECSDNPHSKEQQADCSQILYFWDIDADQSLVSRASHSSYMNSLSFSPSGSHVLAGGGCCHSRSYDSDCDKSLSYWRFDTQEAVQFLRKPSSNITHVAVSPTGMHAVSVASEELHCWQKSSERAPWELVASRPVYPFSMYNIVFNEDGKTLCLENDEGIEHLDFDRLVNKARKS